MAIMALLGTIALNTSTTDIQIMGQFRRSTASFEGAEAGTDLSVPIIERTLSAGTLDPTSFSVNGTAAIIDTANLGNEITGGSNKDGDDASNSPDFDIDDLGGVNVKADIDRMYSYTLPGGAMQFAAGYEGVGAAAAGAGIGILYKIRSQGER
ncbi:MAG: hypothetical protein GWN87_32050 [Desulfuromonadales bacterium]|nr:hypothetical protein [Desulfuromonadales bacterium]NIS44148.1 hypothetical protein [Desulfuromonadales bacterium]